MVANCIAALSEILASEGGMVINTKIAHYLLNRSVDSNMYNEHLENLFDCCIDFTNLMNGDNVKS